MSRSLKFKNNNYLDSTGIVHNKTLLSVLLEKVVFNEDVLKNVDINTINKTCYNYCNECTNIPTIVNGYLFTHRYRDDYIYQKYTTIYGNSYERVKNAGVWENWIKTSPIEIIETITNDNGTAIKFSNGTMICEHIIQGNSFNCSANVSGRYYFSDTNSNVENEKQWIFPVEFISTEDLEVNVDVSSNAYTMSSLGSVSTTYAMGYCVTPYPVSNTTFKWHFKAIGRWK